MKALARIVAVLFLPTVLFGAERVATIKVDGPIGPATESYIARAIEESGKQGAQCLVIQLDTPGGLLDSTKTIVQDLLASPVPTVVYVAPAGATAASAGCFITLAADVAAMAPTTTIGAAHPVELGSAQPPDDTMKTKIENYAVSYIESIATRRKRNVEWARSSVKESASITADQALEKKVIEIEAPDMNDLLTQLQGREINGHKLQTSGATVVEISMTATERVFQKLWRPEVMFVLMLIAIYGLIGEVSNPGVILPGVLGAIALILALYMAAILPVNAAGLAFIALAVLLFLIDVYAPTHGVLTGGGIVSFLLGSLMLFDHAEPYVQLSLGYILPATVVTGLFFIFVVGKGLRAQRLPIKTGKETMIGKTVAALTRIDGSSGKVFIEGEYWNAVSDQAHADAASPHNGYINFETNCGGSLHCSYIEDARRTPGGFEKFTRIPPEIGSRVVVRHSLPERIDPEIVEYTEWFVQLAIPFEVFEKYVGPVRPLAGRQWLGNLYKCADHTSHPHWGTWAPIGEKLNFHRPETFAPIIFE